MHLQAELGIALYLEGLSFDESIPLIAVGQFYIHRTAEDFHPLRSLRAELVITCLHKTEGFLGAVSKLHRAAGDLAAEIDIGFFNDGNVFECI